MMREARRICKWKPGAVGRNACDWPHTWRSQLLRAHFHSGQFHLHAHDWLHFKKEIAGILDAPFGVGNVKFGGSLPMISGEFGVNISNEFVVRAVECDDAFYFKIRWRGEGNLAVNLRWTECRFRKLPGFQDFLVHALVARIVPGFS